MYTQNNFAIQFLVVVVAGFIFQFFSAAHSRSLVLFARAYSTKRRVQQPQVASKKHSLPSEWERERFPLDHRLGRERAYSCRNVLGKVSERSEVNEREHFPEECEYFCRLQVMLSRTCPTQVNRKFKSILPTHSQITIDGHGENKFVNQISNTHTHIFLLL